MRRRGRLPDPSWKSGPTYPEPTDSEHAIDPQPIGHDLDGVGVGEAERIDGAPLLAVREAYVCLREGCDVDANKVHVYSLDDVGAEPKRAAREVCEQFEGPTSDDDILVTLAERAFIIEHDGEEPIIGFDFGGEELGYVYPQETIESGFGGACYGHEAPDPDVNAYRYDL